MLAFPHLIKRVNKEENLLWAFPGGKVGENETLEEACIREIKEETGIEVNINFLLGSRVHPNTNRSMTYYLCDYVSGLEQINSKDEVEKVLFVEPQEIYSYFTTDIFNPVDEYIKRLK